MWIAFTSWLLWIVLLHTWVWKKSLQHPDFSSSEYVSRSDVAGSHGSCRFHLLRNCRTAGPSIWTISRPPSSVTPPCSPALAFWCTVIAVPADVTWCLTVILTSSDWRCGTPSCVLLCVCVLWRKWHPFWPSDTLLVLLHSSAMSLYSANFF